MLLVPSCGKFHQRFEHVLKHSTILRSHGNNSTFKYFAFWDKHQPSSLLTDHFSYKFVYDPYARYHEKEKASGGPYRCNINFYANKIRIYQHQGAIIEALTHAIREANIDGFTANVAETGKALVLVRLFEADSVRELEDILLEYLPRLIISFHPVYAKIIDLFGSDLSRGEIKAIIAAREKVYVSHGRAPDELLKYGRSVARYRSAILQRDRYCCLKCLRSETEVALHIDHIIPVSKGGLTEPDNLQTLCQPCNNAKGNRESISYVL